MEQQPMELGGNVVLVTGGGTGIGFALARRLLAAGSRVVVCGRREQRLREAAAAAPGLVTRVCDLARAEERAGLAEWLTGEFPDLNVLVNNAGVQRRERVADAASWDETRQEIAVNFDAPVHLTGLLLPHLLGRPRTAVVNVSSGLALVPMAAAPVYCATKAALHSYTLSLRHQLAGTPVRVVEILPPSVNTDLGGAGVHAHGAPLDAFADAVVARLAAGELEIAYGQAEARARAARELLEPFFARMNGAPADR